MYYLVIASAYDLYFSPAQAADQYPSLNFVDRPTQPNSTDLYIADNTPPLIQGLIGGLMLE